MQLAGRSSKSRHSAFAPVADIQGQEPLAQNRSVVQLRAVNDSRYRGGTTAGSKSGCAVAAVIGVPLFCFLTLVDALGDCVPDSDCKKGFVPFVVAPTVVVATVLFFVVRFIVTKVWRSAGDG